jgi:hypothetical protein
MNKPPDLTIEEARAEALALELLTRFRGKPQRVSGFQAGRAAQRWIEDRTGQKAMASPVAILAKLQARWVEIVGPRLANVCRPDRLSAGTLTLKCLPAAAPMLSASTVELVGLIRLAGFATVRGLRLIHVPRAAFEAGAGSQNSGQARHHRPRPLAPAEQQALAAKLQQIDDPGLRQALIRLAEAVNGSDA